MYRICERADCAEFSAPYDCLDISEIIVFQLYIDIKISSREVLYHALSAASDKNKRFAAELFRVKMEFFVFVITNSVAHHCIAAGQSQARAVDPARNEGVPCADIFSISSRRRDGE